MIQLKLFGAPAMEYDGAELGRRTVLGRQIALLGLLAYANKRPLTRDKIIALLWPNSPTKTARRRLAQALYTIRLELPEEILLVTGDGLRLNSGCVCCDVVTFNDHIASGDLARAVQLYNGPFFDGFHLPNAFAFNDWLENERERLRRTAVHGAWTLAEQSFANKNIEQAIEYGRWALRLAPADDAGHRRMMELLVAAGDDGGALRLFEDFAKRLRTEYELEPAAATVALAAPIRKRLKLGAAAAGRIAVLPFDVFPNTAEGEALALGMTEEIIAQLANVDGITPIGRVSVMYYRNNKHRFGDMVRQLKVNYVVEGTIRQSGTQVRVTARLIEGHSGGVVWSQAYDRALDDVLSLQQDIALAVVAALRPGLSTYRETFTSRRGAVSPDAYREYLLGRHFAFGTESEQMLAFPHLERAIEYDPAFAPAHATLALLTMLAGESGWVAPDHAFARARSCAERALEIDSTNREGLTALAGVALWHDWNWPLAEELFARALALGPCATADAYVPFCVVMGRVDEAIRVAARDVELEPVSAMAHSSLGWAYCIGERYEDALASLGTARQLRPQYTYAHVIAGWVLVALGDYDGALRSITAEAVRTSPDLKTRMLVGYVQGSCGQRAEAQALLDDFEAAAATRYIDPWCIAVLHATLQQIPEAFAALEKAYAVRSANVVYTAAAAPTLFASIRSESDFERFIKKVGLPKVG